MQQKQLVWLIKHHHMVTKSTVINSIIKASIKTTNHTQIISFINLTSRNYHIYHIIFGVFAKYNHLKISI